MRIAVNVKGDEKLARHLRGIQWKMGKLKPVYKAWALETLKWIQENYKSEGRKLKGRKWRRLRPLTIQSRRQKSHKPLLDTGHLLKQWNYQIKRWGVIIGNPSMIAKYHEEGTRGPYPIQPTGRPGLYRREARALWFGVTPAQRRRGQQLGGRMEWRVKSKPYKKWRKAPGIFRKKVMHPGLPKRRQLPNKNEIMPELARVTEAWLKKVVGE